MLAGQAAAQRGHTRPRHPARHLQQPPEMETIVHKADTHLDILCLARSLLIRVGQGHRLELYPDLHTVTWVLLLVTRLGVTWQMASLSGVIIRLHTEGGLAGLLKYVPFCAVLVSHSLQGMGQMFLSLYIIYILWCVLHLLKLQQTPKPLAQAPSAAPPLLEHSEPV